MLSNKTICTLGGCIDGSRAVYGLSLIDGVSVYLQDQKLSTLRFYWLVFNLTLSIYGKCLRVLVTNFP